MCMCVMSEDRMKALARTCTETTPYSPPTPQARAHDAGAGHLPKISPRVTSSANGKLTVVSTGA